MRARDIGLIVVGLIVVGVVGFMLWLKRKGVPCVLCRKIIVPPVPIPPPVKPPIEGQPETQTDN